MEILYNIKSWCINAVLSISIWNDIILFILGAIIPKICSNFWHNFWRNRQNKKTKKCDDMVYVACCIVYFFCSIYLYKI